VFYKAKLFIKFFSTSTNGKFRKSILLHMICIFIGSLAIFLTFTIMDGMQNEIFEKITSFNYKYSTYLDSNKKNKLKNINNTGVESIMKINGKNFSTFINTYAFNDFHNFINNKIAKHLLYDKINYNDNSIIIGESFSKTYNVNLGDSLIIGDITQINPINGYFKKDKYVVDNIYSFLFLNHDLNNCYIPYKKDFLDRSTNLAFSDNIINETLYTTNNLTSYNSLINAIKLEKYLYTGIGFIVVFISCIMIFNNTIMLILEKLKQKIILNTLGINNLYIPIILFNAFITFIVLILSLSTTLMLIMLNDKYLLLSYIFINSPFKSIPMDINFDKTIISIFIILLMTIISTILSYKSLNKIDNKTIV